jgi:hypothetical protein
MQRNRSNFARSGNPNGTGSTDQALPTYAGAGSQALQIGTTIQAGSAEGHSPLPVSGSLPGAWRAYHRALLTQGARYAAAQLVQAAARRALRLNTSLSEGPPAKHHSAITGSQMAQPNEEVWAKGMIGLPYR